MKYFKKSILFIFILSIYILGAERSGLIFSGVDTISTILFDGYFDFVLQRACTSNADFESTAFQDHIKFSWDGSYLLRITHQGLFKDFGKINLDSIKKSPPDSELVDDNGFGLYRVFEVTHDSLNSLIGTAYVIKTRVDPRRECPFYAKIKILDFIVIDSAAHEVEMVFLWAFNRSCYTNLATTNLDTFKQNTPIASDLKQPSQQSINRKTKTVFKVVGNRLVVPEHLVGKVKYAEVYDLHGRMLGRVGVGKGESVVDLKKVVGGKVAVVRWRL